MRKTKRILYLYSVVTLLLSLVFPAVSYAVATVSTGGAVMDAAADTITFDGSITSDEIIQARGFQTNFLGETEEVTDDANGPYVTGVTWGSQGSGDGQFQSPYGIAIDSVGNIYVADGYNYRIEKFDNTGGFLAKWSLQGPGDGSFGGAMAITIDSTGDVYVLNGDYWTYDIQKFDSSGNFITRWGGHGSADGQFECAEALATDSSNNVYISDRCNYRIQKFDSSGNFIAKWGIQGSGDGQFEYPQGLAVDSADNVYVSDGSNGIQKFDSSGNFIAKLNQNIGYNIPIAVDSAGNIYAFEAWRIQKFDSSGNELLNWELNESYSANGVVVDSSGNIYVTDASNHRIHKIEPNNLTSGDFSIALDDAGEFFEYLCGQSVQYRAYALINGQKIYGHYQDLRLPACTGPDLKLDIALKPPGLIQGNQATYTFTVRNVGSETYGSDREDENTGVGFYILAPDGIEMSNPLYEAGDDTHEHPYYTDNSGTYHCEKASLDSPAFSHYAGTWYGCVSVLPGVVAAGGAYALTLPFTVTGQVDNQVTLRAFIYAEDESDSRLLELLFESFEGDVFDPLFSNNFAIYTGSQPGSGQNSTTISNAENGQPVFLETPSNATLTCSSSLKEPSVSSQDVSYSYPLGLVDFCFNTESENNEVSLTFVTNLKPSQVVARKYNPDTQTYFDIKGATITETTYQSQSALKLTYTITDNGSLDLDPVTGQIKDPVGLGVRDGELAESGVGVYPAAVGLVIVFLSFVRSRKRKLHSAG